MKRITIFSLILITGQASLFGMDLSSRRRVKAPRRLSPKKELQVTTGQLFALSYLKHLAGDEIGQKLHDFLFTLNTHQVNNLASLRQKFLYIPSGRRSISLESFDWALNLESSQKPLLKDLQAKGRSYLTNISDQKEFMQGLKQYAQSKEPRVKPNPFMAKSSEKVYIQLEPGKVFVKKPRLGKTLSQELTGLSLEK